MTLRRGGDGSTTVMEQRLQQLVQQQQQQHERTLTTFMFTQQFEREVPPPGDSSGECGAVAAAVVPDNWTTHGGDGEGGAGSYFCGTAARACDAGCRGGQSGQSEATVLREEGRRLSPYELEQLMQERVRRQVEQALADQRREEEERLASAKVQRDVERLKMHQRTRARVELQLHSGQHVTDRCVAEMGIAAQPEDGSARRATAASCAKAQIRDAAQHYFVLHNCERMQRNLRHREYCREALKEQTAARCVLEQTVGAHHSRVKARLLGTVASASVGGGRSADAALMLTAPCPTIDDLHRARALTAQERAREEVEAAALREELGELAQLDEVLWAERRALKRTGKTPRVREIPYALSAPHRHEAQRAAVPPPSIKLPALGSWKRRSCA